MNKSTRFLIPILLAGLCLLALLTGLGNKAHAEPQVWTTAAPIPEPRGSNLVQCPDDPDGFYLVGGVSDSGTVDTLYHYDAISNTWDTTSLASLPAPRRAVAATCYQGKIYVAGGWDSTPQDSFYIYDIAGDSWSTGTSLPDVVWGASLGAWDGKLYLVGGTRIGQPYTPINNVDMYDIATGVWTPAGGAAMPTAASFFGAVQRGPYLFAVGGFSGDYDNNVAGTQRYNLSSHTWEDGPAFTSQRALVALSMTGSRLYAQGGDLNGGGRDDVTDMVEYLDLSAWPAGSWTALADPLPAENLPAGACTEAWTGGEIWAVGGADFTRVYTENLYRTSEPCLGYNYTLSLAPDSQAGEGYPGETVDYTLAVTNTGDTPDAYTIDVTATWTTTVSMMVGAFNPGESRPVTVTVEVPDGAGLGDSDTATITLTSQGDPAQEASATVSTSAGTPYGVALTPALVELSGLPGVTVTYTLHLSNTGEVTDTYTLAYTGNQWTVQLPVTQTTLAAGESLDVTAYVFVPADATDGEMDTVTVTATSQGEPQVSAGSELTTTAMWWKNFLPVISKS